jgi:gliding motility-associated-like protein
MKNLYISLFSFLLMLTCGQVMATHNRAGEIRVEQTGSLSVKATIITYTKASSVAVDRDTLTICWGDGFCEQVLRSNGKGDLLANDTRRNFYISTHTYGGRNTYKISMTDPNRNEGILNIRNSVSVPFHIETTFTFLSAQFQGSNTTPILLQPPIDIGCIGKPFIHNPNAYDPDGDSLAYRLTVPLQLTNNPVPLYEFPNQIGQGFNNVITMNETSGEFRWVSPQVAGEYNIAILIISYRKGTAIDSTIRDLQILINPCNDNPPVVSTRTAFCIIAGNNLTFDVSANDIDPRDSVILSALGGPFTQLTSPATFSAPIKFNPPIVQGRFSWLTDCNHISGQPYSVVFKAVDKIGLADLKTVNIKVIGPPPTGVATIVNNSEVKVLWDKPYTCEAALNKYFYAFSVWRKQNVGILNDSCKTGLDGSGYTRIAFDTIFPDANGKYFYIDKNLERGKTYCYRILAHFAKRTSQGNPYNLVESVPSKEVCTQLNRDIPLITKASVVSTSTTIGIMRVEWTKPVPKDLDTIKNQPPYRYVLQRTNGINSTGFVDIPGASFTYNSFSAANDTFWDDFNINTLDRPYTYKVLFYAKDLTKPLGESVVASSVFLNIISSDKINKLNWNFNVPWTNSTYIIYRKNNVGVFDSIGISFTNNYDDRDVVNKQEYCYYIKAIGSYGINGVISPLINLSQERCGIPIDTVPPCTPLLTVSNSCPNLPVEINEQFNKLVWNRKPIGCNNNDDAIKFEIYYKPSRGSNFALLTTVNNLNDSIYSHFPKGSLAGCYAIAAIDSVGNKSPLSLTICIDNCPDYVLPNTFTPNGDGQNDIFKPYPYRFVEKVNFEVFNKWGQLVFRTEDPNLSWNGKNLNGDELAEATYFYKCIVFEKRLDGIVQSENVLSGFIELIK